MGHTKHGQKMKCQLQTVQMTQFVTNMFIMWTVSWPCGLTSYNIIALQALEFSCLCCLTYIATESMMTIMENTHAYNVQKAVDQAVSVSASMDTMRF